MIHKVYSLLILSILTSCATFGESGFIPKDPSAAGDVGFADGLNSLLENAPASPVDYTAWIIAGLGAVGVASAGAVRVYKDKKKKKDKAV